MTIIEQMQDITSEHERLNRLLGDCRTRGDVRGYEELEQRMIILGKRHAAHQADLCSSRAQRNF